MALPTIHERGCGVLLHLTSLPSRGSSGTLGPEALRFVDFLARAGQSWWQMLPVAPPGYGGSPYSALSAFAGNPALVSVETLIDDGLLDDSARAQAPDEALRLSFSAFERRGDRGGFRAFCDTHQAWLDDFALYRALKRVHGGVQWTHWTPEHRDRQPEALASARERLAAEISFYKFEQYRFDLDWQALRSHAARQGIALIGDIPIFVAHDSADVWAHRDIFRLREDGEPEVVAGVPPDYFSESGQRWGNPLYRWERLRRQGYDWWIDRFRGMLARFDAVRVDHFIGFQRYWQIPGDDQTAINGRWMKGPSSDLFRAVREALGELPLIAEDLGAVTPAVRRLRDEFGFPGNRVLQFAFGTDPQAMFFLPHNFERRAVAYTGTHDNDTILGWFNDPGGPGTGRTPQQAELERRAALGYLGLTESVEVHWAMIRALYASVANLVIIPLQDLLGLGSEGRMNRPGQATGNWTWRFESGVLTTELADRLRALAKTYGRLTTSTLRPTSSERRPRTEPALDLAEPRCR